MDSSLIGGHVHLRYDASIPPARRRVTVSLDGKPWGEARIVDTYANSRVRRSYNSDHLVVEKQPQESPPQPTPLKASLAASLLPEVSPREPRP